MTRYLPRRRLGLGLRGLGVAAGAGRARRGRRRRRLFARAHGLRLPDVVPRPLLPRRQRVVAVARRVRQPRDVAHLAAQPVAPLLLLVGEWRHFVGLGHDVVRRAIIHNTLARDETLLFHVAGPHVYYFFQSYLRDAVAPISHAALEAQAMLERLLEGHGNNLSVEVSPDKVALGRVVARLRRAVRELARDLVSIFIAAPRALEGLLAVRRLAFRRLGDEVAPRVAPDGLLAVGPARQVAAARGLLRRREVAEGDHGLLGCGCSGFSGGARQPGAAMRSRGSAAAARSVRVVVIARFAAGEPAKH
ncbi:unnamed protein product, partial [Pelagomonas calceolata]